MLLLATVAILSAKSKPIRVIARVYNKVQRLLLEVPKGVNPESEAKFSFKVRRKSLGEGKKDLVSAETEENKACGVGVVVVGEVGGDIEGGDVGGDVGGDGSASVMELNAH